MSIQPFDIVSSIKEKLNIQSEIKRLQQLIRDLKKKDAIIEEKMQKYLEDCKSQGIIVNNTTIINKQIKKSKTIPKNIKEENIKKILNQHVPDSNNIIKQIQDLNKGSETVKNKIILTINK
jgi:hypothetical protein